MRIRHLTKTKLDNLCQNIKGTPNLGNRTDGKISGEIEGIVLLAIFGEEKESL